MATATLRAVLEGFDQAKQELSGLGQQVDSLGQKSGDVAGKNREAANSIEDMGQASEMSAGKIGLVAIAAAAATAAVVALTKSSVEHFKATVELGDRYNELSQLTGRTVESLSGLSLAFETNGLSMERGAKGLERFGKYLFEAQNGNKEASRTFAALGLDVQQFGNDADAALSAFSDKIASVKDGHEKTAIVMRAFRDPQFVTFLNEGSEGMRKLAEEAKNAGLVMSSETARAADELNDALAVLSANTKGFWQEASAPFIKAFAEITTAMRDARREGEGFFGMLQQGMIVTARLTVFGSEQSQLVTAQKRLSEVRANIGRALATGDVGLQRSSEAEEASLVGDVRRLSAFTNPSLTNVLKGDAPDLPDKPGKAVKEPKEKKSELNGELEAQRSFYKDMLELGKISQSDYFDLLQGQLAAYGDNIAARTKIELAWKSFEDKELRDSWKLFEEAQKKEKDLALFNYAERQRAAKELSKTNTDAAERAIKDAEAVVYWTREGKAKALGELRSKYEEMGNAGEEAVKRIDKAMADNERSQQTMLQSVFQIKSAFGQLGFDLLAIFANIPRSMQQNMAEVLKGHQSVAQGIKNIWKNVGDSIINELSRLGTNSIMSLLFGGSGGGGGWGGHGQMPGGGGGLLGNILGGGGGGGGGLINSVMSFFSGGPSAGESDLAQFGAELGSDWGASSMFSSMGGPASIISWLGGPFGALFGGGQLGSVFGNVIGDVAGGVGDFIGDIFGGLFATGTDQVVTSPKLVMVGENGPERLSVTPLSTSGAGGGNGGMVVVNGPLILDEFSSRTWQRQQARAFRSM